MILLLVLRNDDLKKINRLISETLIKLDIWVLSLRSSVLNRREIFQIYKIPIGSQILCFYKLLLISVSVEHNFLKRLNER